jgi:hypothetical protein
MIYLEEQYAKLRPNDPHHPGQVRARFRAVEKENEDDENGTPAAVFLCCVEPPDSFRRKMRESFQTVCSVEDLAEYPVGVSTVEEVDPASQEEGTFLYAVQENKIYVRSPSEPGPPAWLPYAPAPGGLPVNVHSHKLPFFRRSAIDIILPSRRFVRYAVEEIKNAIRELERDRADLERFEESFP